MVNEERRIASAAEDKVDVDSELEEEPDADLELVDSKREDEPTANPDASTIDDKQGFAAGQRSDEAG